MYDFKVKYPKNHQQELIKSSVQKYSGLASCFSCRLFKTKDNFMSLDGK